MALAFPEGFHSTRGVVKVVGLLPESNAVHATVWGSLSRSQSVAVTYQLSSVDRLAPPRKEKAARRLGLMEDDDYEPPGIIKAGWMLKHGTQVPAVVLACHDAEESVEWERQQEAIVAMVKSISAAVQKRPVRVVTVLLQSKPLPLIEDRILALRAACTPHAKYNVVTINTADSETSVGRLDGNIQEHARQYYMDLQAGVQALAESLKPSSELMMLARYAFKMGFFSELRQDPKEAVNHYRNGYKFCQRLPLGPERLWEFKTVAGLFAAKVCSCLLRLGLPLDALKESREHLAFFRGHFHRENEMFLSEAWIAQQYFYFAEIFSECPKFGVQLLSTQHPGFYYRFAAQHTMARRKHADKHCIDARLGKMKAFFKPPVYLGQVEIDVEYLPEDAREKGDYQQHLLTCAAEVTFPHSEAIVSLLSSALQHFRPFAARQPRPATPTQAPQGASTKSDETVLRIMQNINMEMAQELVLAGNHEQAAKLMEPAIEMYRRESWPSLLTACLLSSLKSAYQSANIELYVKRALELSGRGAARSLADRTLHQSNFMRILQNHEPAAEAGLRATSEAWGRARASVPMAIDLSELRDCIDCKVSFGAKTAEAHSTLTLHVVLFSHLPLPLTFTNIRATFNSPNYKTVLMQCDGVSCETEHALVPQTSKVLTLTFPTMAATPHTLKCRSISIDMGDPARLVQLQWRVSSEPGRASAAPPPTKERLEIMAFEDITSLPALSVTSRQTKLSMTLSHAPPALVQERYAVTVHVHNEDNERVRDVRLRVRLMDTSEPPQPLQQSGMVSVPGGQGQGSEAVVSLGDVAPHTDRSLSIALSFASPLVCSLQLHLEYHTGSGVEAPHVKDLNTRLECVMPFEVSFHLETLTHEQIDFVHQKLSPGERFLLVPEVRSLVPWPVEVVRCEMRLRDSDAPYPYTLGDVDEGPSVLESGEVLSRCICLGLPRELGDISLGLFALYWRRASAAADAATCNRTLYTLPTIAMAQPALRARMHASSTGHVGCRLPLSFTIANHSPALQELEASLQPSDAFMCSGSIKTSVRIPPATYGSDGSLQPSTHTLSYNLFPLSPGPYVLPTLTLLDVRADNAHVPVYGEKHVYIYSRALHVPSGTTASSLLNS